MTFKYSATLPISGPNKLRRFRDWATAHVSGLSYILPPQVPVEAESMTIRLSSLADRARVLEALARAPLPAE